jgi:hypothetical protein
MATYLELQNAVLEACGHTTAASSVPRTRIKRHINSWHREILTRPGHSRLLRDSEYTFDTVAAQHTYGLGIPMGRLLGVHERTNESVLQPQTVGWLRANDPGLSATGDPASVYVPRGWFPVQAHPATADDVWAKSSNAADTTQVVDWEFTLATMQRVSGNTTLNGTTAVQLGTATNIVEIVKLSMRTAAAGTVTVHQTTGTGTTLLTLPIGQQYGRFLHLQLWPTPAAVTTYRLDCTREIEDMVQDTDIPLLPRDFHPILALGAEYEEWRKLSDDRASMVYQDLEKRLRSLNAWLWDLPDDTMGATVGRSRLGGWYEAGT